METPFMEFFAPGLADGGLRIVRFEFPLIRRSKGTSRTRIWVHFSGSGSRHIVDAWKAFLRVIGFPGRQTT